MKRPGKVEFYKSRNGWRWRVVASNGRKLANCGQGYSRKSDCIRDFRIVVWDSLDWPVRGLQ